MLKLYAYVEGVTKEAIIDSLRKMERCISQDEKTHLESKFHYSIYKKSKIEEQVRDPKLK